MNYYQEKLEKANKIIQGSKIKEEEKTFLSNLISRLSLPMLEIFVWTMEEDEGNAEAIVTKTHKWIAVETDPVELKKAIDADKKEMERLMMEEEELKPEPV